MLSSFKSYIADFRLRGNLYVLLAWRLTLLMLLFTLTRLLFFTFNRDFFANTTPAGLTQILWGGLRFDISAILYTNLLYLVLFLLPFTFRYKGWYQRGLKWLFAVTNSVAIGASCADLVYFRFTLRRTTASVFDEFRNETNLGALTARFIADYWYIFLIWIALTALLVLLYGKVERPVFRSQLKYRLVYFVNGLVMMLISFVLIVGGLRGGFRHSTRPITLSNAGQYIKEPLEAAIVLNTPFAIYRTLQKKSLQQASYYTQEELEGIYNPVHRPAPTQPMRKSNVVIFILESFGREYIGRYNGHLKPHGYGGFTPFLDSIIGRSLYFTHSFANGRKSIDAMPSNLASIPMLVEPYLLTSYSGNRVNSIASLLRDEGYHTAFFHGAPNGSMGFQAFSNVAGFQEYYGLNEYPDPDGFDGVWGIWDEEFFRFFADKLNTFRQPFCAAMFSVSSHHPFKVPGRHIGKFPTGTLPIHQCIAYTDYALKRFFEKASQMPWFDSTLFVFTGDHGNQIHFPEYRTNAGVFAVPVIFYTPDGALRQEVDGLAQQIDIMPSVLGYLRYPKPFLAFGRNLFDSAQEAFVVNYTEGAYQLFMDDYLLFHNGDSATGLYLFKTDRLLSTNLIKVQPEVAKGMERKLKAIIQQYNGRMIEDRLTVGAVR